MMPAEFVVMTPFAIEAKMLSMYCLSSLTLLKSRALSMAMAA
jgi:hypothetical protein